MVCQWGSGSFYVALFILYIIFIYIVVVLIKWAECDMVKYFTEQSNFFSRARGSENKAREWNILPYHSEVLTRTGIWKCKFGCRSPHNPTDILEAALSSSRGVGSRLHQRKVDINPKNYRLVATRVMSLWILWKILCYFKSQYLKITCEDIYLEYYIYWNTAKLIWRCEYVISYRSFALLFATLLL